MTIKFLIFQILTLFSLILAKANSNYPAFFNFGDSNSDTGTDGAAPTHYNTSTGKFCERYGHFIGRHCDGRLIIDFLMESIKFDYLHRYQVEKKGKTSFRQKKGITSFRQGCNFAVAGSTISKLGRKELWLHYQVDQFVKFRKLVHQLVDKGENVENLPAKDSFGKGLYMFDIGQNDLSVHNASDETYNFILNLLTEFEKSLKRLYDRGARNFWIHNTGPLGCLPYKVAGTTRNFSNAYGRDGSKLCASGPNQAAQFFNQQLHDLCRRLRRDFKASIITYVDIYTIKFDLIKNYSQYGFEQPIMACCGSGGPPKLNLGSPRCCNMDNQTHITREPCKKMNKYVNWDGIHYTEAANLHVSKKILTGLYSDPLFANIKN